MGLRGAADGMKKRVQVGMSIFTIWASSSRYVKYLKGGTTCVLLFHVSTLLDVDECCDLKTIVYDLL